MSPELVLVHWLDAVHNSDQLDEVDVLAFRPVPVTTLGYLMADEPEYLTIVGERIAFEDDETCYRATHCIPRGMVVKVETLLRPA